MNRKKGAKLVKAGAKKKAHSEHPFDNISDWIGADFSTPPLDTAWQAEYQRKLDSAFGAENAIILAWSGDRQYWDEFYTDWFSNGTPKPNSLEKKPILLFGKYDVNETDYLYVNCPRWLLLEREDRSQYEASWEASSWVGDANMIGGQKRIRNVDVPRYMYKHLRTIAKHMDTVVQGYLPPCCKHLRENFSRICYGKYRPPSDIDLAFVRTIRENMDASGVSQRNDEARGAKILQDATASTKFYIHQAERQRMTAVQEWFRSDPKVFLADMLINRGITLSSKEIDECVEIGLRQEEEERFGAK